MKDFFFFSKSQRIGILLLLLLIVAVIVITQLLHLFVAQPAADEAELNRFKEEAAVFEKNLQQKELTRQAAYQKKYTKTPQTNKLEQAGNMFCFNPNTADSVDFVRLGISPYTTHNILNYRRKDGFFKDAAHFGRTYGLSAAKFEQLQPYIVITERLPMASDSVLVQNKTVKRDTILELNTADTTELMLIKGIGRAYARAIVRYRQQLGGFLSVEQLREIPYMKEENYLRIKDSFTVNSSLVTPIKVNKASIERLEKHPYITFTQAQSIYEQRRMKFKLKSIDQLSGLDYLTPDDIVRLTPYLSFEAE